MTRGEATESIQSSTRAGTPLHDAVTAAEPPSPIDLSGLALAPGDQIGPYTLIKVLGEGGFGIVFEAERRQPMVQRVALKVLKPGMDSRAVLTRFDHERQTLALLDHPNLARVLDAGATPRGLPYFVMELVRGRTIGEYADQKKLTLRERLELILPVCEAVQHAHMRGIIHRDLKPSNIIVAQHEGIATPKVIDFGIAKALATDATDATLVTEQGQAIGTPEYMSPEQADGLADVDTRTDVYSLGVVLYELLTGVLPFDSRSLRSGGHAAMKRMIREQIAPRASTRLSCLGADSSVIAGNRSIDLRGLVRTLRNELEWIPLKAMSKERERRYEGAHDLAEDIRNYLAGRVLMAGPESFSYKARKFVGRNRLLVGSASVVALALVAGLAGTAYGLIRAERSALAEHAARTKAEARLRDVRALADSLLFDLNSEIENLPGATGVRKKLIDTALPYLDRMAAEAGDDPEVLADLASGYYRLGELQGAGRSGNLGNTGAALINHTKAIAIRRKLVGIDPRNAAYRADLANSLQAIGHVYRLLEKLPESDRSTEESLTLARDAVAQSPSRSNRVVLSRALTARSWTDYELERTNESEALAREALALDESLSKEDPTDWKARSAVAIGYSDLGDLMDRADRSDQAAAQYARAVEVYREILASNPSRIENRLSLAGQLRKLGSAKSAMDRGEEALAALRESADLAAGAAREDPLNASAESSLRRSMARLGDALQSLSRFDEALDVRFRTLALMEQFSAKSPDDLSRKEDLSTAEGDVATSLRSLGRFEDAERHAQRTVNIDRAVLAAGPSVNRQRYLSNSLVDLGDVLTDAGRYGQGEEAYREGLEIRERLLTQSPRSARFRGMVASTTCDLGVLFTLSGRAAEAIPLLERSVRMDAELAREEPQSAERAESVITRKEWLAKALSLAGRHEPAAELIAECVKWRRATGDSPGQASNLADTLGFQGTILLRAADAHSGSCTRDDAKRVLEEAVALTERPGVRHAMSLRMKQRLVEVQRVLDELAADMKPDAARRSIR